MMFFDSDPNSAIPPAPCTPRIPCSTLRARIHPTCAPRSRSMLSTRSTRRIAIATTAIALGALVFLRTSSGSATSTLSSANAASFGSRADTLREEAARRLAQIDGRITIPGLDSSVEVRRDRWGVPHIYARTEHDLFFAQGFVAAQDRLWQMEMWRRQAEGRLAEVLGA